MIRLMTWMAIFVVGSFGMTQNLLALFSVAGDRQVGSIDPTNGSIALFASPINGASLSSSGGSAYDATGNLLYFVGSPMAGTSIYTVSMPGGTATSQLLSPSQSVLGLEYDAGEGVSYGFFSVSGDRQIGTVNPVNGTTVLLGSPINGASLSSSANSTLNETGNRLYFVGTPSMGVPSIYSVNTATGAATAQALSPNTPVSMLAFNQSAGTLYALFSISGGRQLGTINPGTGAVTLIGSPLNGGASISTGSDSVAINEASDDLYFVGDSVNIYTVDLATGVGSSQAMPAGTTVVSLEYDPNALPVELIMYMVD